MECKNKSCKCLFKCSAFVFEMMKYYGNFLDWRRLMTSLCKQTNQFWERKRTMFETLDSMCSRDTRQILKILKKCCISAWFDKKMNLTVDFPLFIDDTNNSAALCQLKGKKLRNINTIKFLITPFSLRITDILISLTTENIVNVEAIEIIKQDPSPKAYLYSVLSIYAWNEFKRELAKKSKEIGLKRIKISGSVNYMLSDFVNGVHCDTLELDDCNMDMNPEFFASYVTSIGRCSSLPSIKTLTFSSCSVRYCCDSCVIRAQKILKRSPFTELTLKRSHTLDDSIKGRRESLVFTGTRRINQES